MEMYSLECSCTFHQQCLKNFVHASCGSMESLAAMRCPNCRKDAIEMRESAAAAALAAGELGDLSAGSSSGGGLGDLSAQSDHVSPITVDDVSASREITGDLAIADTEVAEGDMEDAPGGPQPADSAPADEFPESDMSCTWCGTKAIKLRCVSKRKCSFKCNTCNTRLVQLNAIYGNWPTEQFRLVSDAAKQEFYASIADVQGKVALETKTSAFLNVFEKNASVYSDVGEFLPLSVWQAKGFNIDDIERNTQVENTADHPVLGKVYRVAILSTGQAGEQGTERRTKLAKTTGAAATSSSPASIGGAAAAPVAANTAQSREAAQSPIDDDGSDSASSASNGKNDQKKIKQKEAKRAKKEKRRLAKQLKADREKAKEIVSLKKKASAIAAKLSAGLPSAKEVLAQPIMVQLPRIAVENVESKVLHLEDTLKRARLVMQDGPSDSLGDMTVIIASKLLSDAKKAASVLSTMAKTVTRMGL